MARIHILIYVFALLAVIAGCEDGENALPEVDGDRAYARIVDQCDMGPRYPGSPGHEQLIEYIRSFLAERVDSLRLDEFTRTDSAGKEHNLTNIVGMFRPAHGSRVLLCCHFDTRPVSDEAADPEDQLIPVPGANDGASGVAVLMEAAELFHERKPDVGVDLVFFDGEDNPAEMLLGSKRFVERNRTYRPLFGILVDMVGDADLNIKKEQYSNMVAPEVVGRVWRKAASLGYGDVFLPEVGYALIDDHIPLLKNGIRCIDIIDFEYPYWHTPQDTPDKCSPRSLEIVTNVLVSLIYDLR